MCSISANFVNDILNKPDDYYLPICYLTFGNYDKNIPFFARNSFLDFNYRILSYYNIPINIRNLSDDWNFLIFFKMIISAHYSLFEGSTGCGISFVQYRIFSNAKFLLRKVLFLTIYGYVYFWLRYCGQIGWEINLKNFLDVSSVFVNLSLVGSMAIGT